MTYGQQLQLGFRTFDVSHFDAWSDDKNHEKMTVTMNGGGSIGTLMACTHSDGKLKLLLEIHMFITLMKILES